MRSAVVGLNRRHSRSATSGPRQQPGGQVQRLQIGPNRIGQPQRLAHHPPVRLKRPRQRRSRKPLAPAGDQRAPVHPQPLIGHIRDDYVVAQLHRGLLVAMQLKRLLHRPVQPPQRLGPPTQRLIGALLEWGERAVGLGSAVLQQIVEPHRGGVDIELQRLPGRRPRDQLAERVRHRRPFTVRHDQRVLRRHAQVAHQRPLAGHQHTAAVERLNGQQLARLWQLARGGGDSGVPQRLQIARPWVGPPVRRRPIVGFRARRGSRWRSGRGRAGSDAAGASSANPHAAPWASENSSPMAPYEAARGSPGSRQEMNTVGIAAAATDRSQTAGLAPPRLAAGPTGPA